jgi:predicted nucleic acid-binding protein
MKVHMNEFVVDSSVFLSLMLREEDSHKSTKKAWEYVSNMPQGVILFPRLVVLEMSNRYHQLSGSILHMNHIHEIIESMGGAFQMDMDDELHEVANELIPKLSLKTSDLIIVAHAKLAGATLLTWDKRMIREASKAVKVITPEEVLSISS